MIVLLVLFLNNLQLFKDGFLCYTIFFYLTMTLQLLFTFLIFSFWILLFFKDEIFFFKNLPGEWNLQSQHLLSVLWFSSFASSHRSGFRPIHLFCLFFKQKNEWFWWLNSIMEFFFLKFMLLGFNGFLSKFISSYICKQ